MWRRAFGTPYRRPLPIWLPVLARVLAHVPAADGCTSSSAVACHGSGMGHALATLVLAVVGVLASSGRKGIVTESRRGPHYGPCWTRTNDLGIKSPLLYQLS